MLPGFDLTSAYQVACAHGYISGGNVNSQEIKARVTVLIRNAGGTYRAAGNQAEVSPATVSAWNRRLRQPSPQSQEKLRANS
jgi:hypothetical protein